MLAALQCADSIIGAPAHRATQPLWFALAPPPDLPPAIARPRLNEMPPHHRLGHANCPGIGASCHETLLPVLSVFAICWCIASVAMAQHVAYKLRQPSWFRRLLLHGPKTTVTREKTPKHRRATSRPAHAPAELTAFDLRCRGCLELRAAKPSCGCEQWLLQLLRLLRLGLGNCLGDLLPGRSVAPCKVACNPAATGRSPTAAGSRWATTTDNDRLSVAPNDLLSFEDNPDRLNLDQAWLYVEKIAATTAAAATGVIASTCSTASTPRRPRPSATTTTSGTCRWINGSYGWAMPQAYAEVGLRRLERQGRSLLHARRLRSDSGDRQLLLQPFVHDVQQRAVYPHRRVGHVQGQRRS